MFDPRATELIAVVLFGKSVPSTALARNIVQALAYRCLPSPKFQKDISWHISYYFFMFREIFPRRAIS